MRRSEVLHQSHQVHPNDTHHHATCIANAALLIDTDSVFGPQISTLTGSKLHHIPPKQRRHSRLHPQVVAKARCWIVIQTWSRTADRLSRPAHLLTCMCCIAGKGNLPPKHTIPKHLYMYCVSPLLGLGMCATNMLAFGVYSRRRSQQHSKRQP